MRNLALAALLLCASPALAAGKPAEKSAAKPAASSTKLDKIHKLLVLTHAEQGGVMMLEALKRQMPPAQFERVAKLIKPQEIVERIVPVYDRHFSEAEIDGLIAFYQTPLGQRVVTEMPAVGQESVQVGQQYAVEVLQKLRAEQQEQPADVPAKK